MLTQVGSGGRNSFRKALTKSSRNLAPAASILAEPSRMVLLDKIGIQCPPISMDIRIACAEVVGTVNAHANLHPFDSMQDKEAKPLVEDIEVHSVRGLGAVVEGSVTLGIGLPRSSSTNSDRHIGCQYSLSRY